KARRRVEVSLRRNGPRRGRSHADSDILVSMGAQSIELDQSRLSVVAKLDRFGMLLQVSRQGRALDQIAHRGQPRGGFRNRNPITVRHGVLFCVVCMHTCKHVYLCIAFKTTYWRKPAVEPSRPVD